MKELLYNEDASRITDIKDTYDGNSQGWSMTFKFLNGKPKDVTLPIVARTRFGGLQGKAFFLSSSLPVVDFIIGSTTIGNLEFFSFECIVLIF